MASIVWGIDIGTSAVKVVKARSAGARIEVLDFDIVEIPFDEDESTRQSRVRQVLSEITARKNVGTAPVYVSIPGNQTFFRPFTLPTVEERRVAEIVQYEARQQIPFPFEEILWGYQHQLTPEGEMQVRLVAVRRDDVNGLLVMMREVGLSVGGLVAAPVALFNFAAYEFSMDATTLVLDCGAKMTDFLVMEGGAFWFRPLTVGVEEMTRTLKQKFRIGQEEAENILFKMDKSKQAEKMFQVIEPVIRNLAGDVQRSLGYYKSLSHNVRVERVIGLGGAFRMPQIREYVGGMLGQEVEIPKGAQKFSAAPGLDAGWFNDEVGSMSIALGLAVQGLGLARADINLLPEEVVHEKMIRRKKPWVAIAALAIVAAVGFSNFVQGKIREGYKRDVDRADELIDRVKLQDRRFRQEMKGIAPLDKRLEFYSRIGRDRSWFVDCLNKVNVALTKTDPRGGTLSDKQPLIYLKQLYMSRYPEESCRIELEEDPDEMKSGESGRREPIGGPGPIGPPRRGLPGVVAEADEQMDKPMMVVIYAEIRGEKGIDEVRIEPAFMLRSELDKIECFEKPDLMGGWTAYQRLAMSREDYYKELEKQRKGEEHKIVTRPFKMFKMAWRYDDGTDIREKAVAEAPENKM